MMVRTAVLASGGGSNLKAILSHLGQTGNLPSAAHRPVTGGKAAAQVVLVVSDRNEAGALEHARRAGVETAVVPVTGRDQDAVARDTLETLAAAGTELVLLAGYLRRVPAAVVRNYRGRMLNIHPALLPAFGGKGMYGMHVHRAVMEAGCRVTGVTIHFVDEEYDRGPILIQWPVPVLLHDTAESLAERVLKVEHLLYPAAVEALCGWIAAGVDPEELASGSPDVKRGYLSEPASFDLGDLDEPSGSSIRRALGLD